MSLTLGAVIDPRIKVIRRSPIVILTAVDDAGRVQGIPELQPGENMTVSQSNFWTQSITWAVTNPGAKNISVQAEVRFVAQISSAVVQVEDATKKVGEVITIGDKQLRIAQFSADNDRLAVQLSPVPAGGTTTVNFLVTDASGKTYGNPTATAVSGSFPLNGAQGPFRLTLTAPGESRTLSYQFELPEIPAP